MHVNVECMLGSVRSVPISIPQFSVTSISQLCLGGPNRAISPPTHTPLAVTQRSRRTKSRGSTLATDGLFFFHFLQSTPRFAEAGGIRWNAVTAMVMRALCLSPSAAGPQKGFIRACWMAAITPIRHHDRSAFIALEEPLCQKTARPGKHNICSQCKIGGFKIDLI